MQFDTAVVIGRFQPLHNAHINLLKEAGELARQVIVVCGSSDQPRTIKNPFTSKEREEMLRGALKNLFPKTHNRFIIEHNRDTIYNDQAWIVRIQKIVAKHTEEDATVKIVGHIKDDSSFYLSMFPQWGFHEYETQKILGATQIRDFYLDEKLEIEFLDGVVPKTTFEFLKNFRKTADYQQLLKEKSFIKNYKKQYEHLTYEPIFLTTDAVVIQSGNVLMVKRKSEPGKGLWAFPGGFLDAKSDKTVVDGMLRELKEETGIDVPVKVLRGSIADNKVFDAIERSLRGRTITHAYKIVLNSGEWSLPKVKGSSDAEKAKWIPINNLRSDQCFEDHYDILQYFLGD